MALKTPKVASTRLSLPLGVAGAEPSDAAVGTLAFATDTDTVRVKTSSGWEDVGGGGGGSITEVQAGDGIQVTNPTGPIVTVEADIQEIQAGDGISVTNGTGPVVTISNDGFTPPYITPPASPNAFDFEAASAGSADLASLGWDFRRVTTLPGAMTRVGEIYPYRDVGTNTALTTYQYRSSLINGRLYLQLPLDVGSVIYSLCKAISIPASTTTDGAYLWVKAQPGVINATGSGSYAGLLGPVIAKDNGGVAGTRTNSVMARVYVNSTGSSTFVSRDSVYFIAGASTVLTAQASVNYVSTFDDIIGIKLRNTSPNSSFTPFLASPGCGGWATWPPSNAGTGLGATSAYVWAGLNLETGTAAASVNGQTPWDYVIDFMRLYTGDLSGIWVGAL